ncbi:FAD-dependent monooxygenase [Fusarium austroafricanum]|uniref:FAD-dependent monooxygenase n=1 Tax=Fusarium austroafricanum TaxID=2364996 RepID=A0A8H4KD83_9HYPO|nr:FAD-dependent monooxygenase [Fusarium austroafricanum]
MRVLIIGGGIGGLTLAHGLRKADIKVLVFERQASIIPLTRRRLFIRDTQLRVLAEKDDAKLSKRPPLEVERTAVGRLELRETLLQGLEGIVQWGCSFVRYEKLSNGLLRTHFSDGTSEDCDLLVGADGPNSAVRGQYMPTLERFDLGIRAIAGRYALDHARIKMLPDELTNGSLNNIVPSGRGLMFISAWGSGQAAGYDSGDDSHYVVWAYVLPVNNITSELDNLSTSDLQNHVLYQTQDWSPDLKELVQGSDLSTIKCLSIRTMPTLEPWEPSNVTLLGDAVHNMTSMAGMGTNTALRDAEVLTRCLIDVKAGRFDLVQGVGLYESDMRSYGNDALKLSTQNAMNACNGRKASRFLFRSFLRTAQSFPAVMRATMGRSAS